MKKNENKNSNNSKYKKLVNKVQGISILIPAYNEDESLPKLMEEIKEVMDGLKKISYEVVVINDGSTDNTQPVIEELEKKYKNLRSIHLRRNFGKATALSMGAKRSEFDYILMMDADLQDDPKEIPNFVEAIEEGYDLICGWKQNRKDSFIKVKTSKIYNYITSVASGVYLHDHNCGFKMLRKDILINTRLYGELHRYIPVFASSLGYKIKEIPVKHRAREFGKSKYGIKRFFYGAIDLLSVITITRYAGRPAHLFGGLGSVIFAIGCLFLTYLSGVWLFTDEPIGSRPLLLVSVMFIIIGIQILIFGLLSELMVSRLPMSRQHLIKKDIIKKDVKK